MKRPSAQAHERLPTVVAEPTPAAPAQRSEATPASGDRVITTFGPTASTQLRQLQQRLEAAEAARELAEARVAELEATLDALRSAPAPAGAVGCASHSPPCDWAWSVRRELGVDSQASTLEAIRALKRKLSGQAD